MADSQEELEAITDAVAAGPQSAGNKAENATSHSIPDLIALEKHRAEVAASRSGNLGVRFFNTKPPGAT